MQAKDRSILIEEFSRAGEALRDNYVEEIEHLLKITGDIKKVPPWNGFNYYIKFYNKGEVYQLSLILNGDTGRMEVLAKDYWFNEYVLNDMDINVNDNNKAFINLIAYLKKRIHISNLIKNGKSKKVKRPIKRRIH